MDRSPQEASVSSSPCIMRRTQSNQVNRPRPGTSKQEFRTPTKSGSRLPGVRKACSTGSLSLQKASSTSSVDTAWEPQKQCSVAKVTPKLPSYEFLERAFKKMDVNKNGSLACVEFMQAVHILGVSGDYSGLWRHLDKDHDGTVTLKEFLGLRQIIAEAWDKETCIAESRAAGEAWVENLQHDSISEQQGLSGPDGEFELNHKDECAMRDNNAAIMQQSDGKQTHENESFADNFSDDQTESSEHAGENNLQDHDEEQLSEEKRAEQSPENRSDAETYIHESAHCEISEWHSEQQQQPQSNQDWQT